MKIDPNVVRNGVSDPNIRIYDSYKITTRAEREAILDVIINSPEFDSTIFKRGKHDWMSEWAGHNFLYCFLSSTPLESNLKDVDLDEGEWVPWNWFFS